MFILIINYDFLIPFDEDPYIYFAVSPTILIHHLFISGSYIVNRHCPPCSYASSYSVIESAYEKIACVSAAATDFCGIYIQLAVAEILFIHRLRFWLSYIDEL